MHCYTVDGSGPESLKLVERPAPGEPGPEEVLVNVHAVSLNYRDLMVADGRYGGRQDPAIVAASDMSGMVVSVGANVHGLKTGDRVLNAPFRHWPTGKLRSDWARTFVGGGGLDGVLAEQILYPAESLVKIPEIFSFAEGSTLTVAGLTAWAAVVTHGRVRAGEWVVLHGTGGVSLFGAQIAKMCGARTILTTSNQAKVEAVRRRVEIDATVDYRDENWPEKVREITGGGADLVVEVAGGTTLARSIQCCTYGGRVGVIGVLDGAKSPINVVDLLLHQVTVHGIFMESTAELRKLAAALEEADLHPIVERTFAFEEAADAYTYLREQKHFGKVCIAVR